MPGGKQERRASRPLFFLYINNETNKNRRGVFGVQGLLPLGEPRNTCRILRQVVRGTEMRTPEKCVQL